MPKDFLVKVVVAIIKVHSTLVAGRHEFKPMTEDSV
jgi:hypothetical protein